MISQHEQDFINILFPILCCPQCKNPDLKLIDRSSDSWSDEIKLLDKEIKCEKCSSLYPVTDDFIPIMWTESIEQYLKKQLGEEGNTLVANMTIYDSISDDYNVHSRRNEEITTRLNNSAVKLIGKNHESGVYHLDFGCGPGHVLEWLKKPGFTQFGLDVSLVNLRTARKQANAFVVCGDASNMPFINECFDLVTESSALHHIEAWQECVSESCRVTKSGGGIVMDSEPSKDQMNWSWLAIQVFEARFIPYQILGYLLPKSRFYLFRDREQAKLNMLAEIHNQPKAGFPLKELQALFESSGFNCEVVQCPTPDLKTVCKPSKQNILINFLSMRNPWNSKYGAFIALAHKL
jgi:ubiquinone/menaquinone biosynthesis C-methylase UbiE/uncharacterized protein YbaR (Trm112 family)